MAIRKTPGSMKVIENPVPENLTVTLALQGGGSHGAFTWGVLDYLLEQPHIHIEGISATSTGALNAVVMLSGLAQGGRQKARSALERFWNKTSIAAAISPFQPTFFDRMLGNNRLAFSPAFMAMDLFTSMFSPAQLNLFDFNPVRDIVRELVDFRAVHAHQDTRLFLSATEVHTGHARVFSNPEVTLDAVMASACFPYLFKAVRINGTPFWDGSFTGNPVLRPLVKECSANELFIIQSIPTNDAELPVKSTEILDRASEISFNATLRQEMKQIEFVNRLIADGALVKGGFRPVHMHVIESADILSSMDRASKFNADWSFLEYLREAGRQAAEDWFRQHGAKLGKQSTFVAAA